MHALHDMIRHHATDKYLRKKIGSKQRKKTQERNRKNKSEIIGNG